MLKLIAFDMEMEALHCGLRVLDELQNIAVNFFLFNGLKINIFVR